MKKTIFFIFCLILIPLLIIGIDNTEELINRIKYGIKNNTIIKVKDTKTNKIYEVPLEEYVIGVVAGETPISFNDEAIKAQAVAARTYALKKKETTKSNFDVTNDTNYQVYLTKDQMLNKWKNNYNENYSKIKSNVLKTKGEVILYNNELIDAMFFSTSNGYTENSGDVFSNSVPYLKSVSSSWDQYESPVFNTTVEITKKEFLFNLGINDNSISISNIEKTNTGRVKSITINGKKFDSKEIRKIFNLRSTSFTITLSGDKVIFNVKGFGHGVGMSQYGANGMAKEGYNYKEIFQHYYKETEIKKIN